MYRKRGYQPSKYTPEVRGEIKRINRLIYVCRKGVKQKKQVEINQFLIKKYLAEVEELKKRDDTNRKNRQLS